MKFKVWCNLIQKIFKYLENQKAKSDEIQYLNWISSYSNILVSNRDEVKLKYSEIHETELNLEIRNVKKQVW